MGSCVTAIPPARVIAIESTEAKMGRSMKKRKIKTSSPQGGFSMVYPRRWSDDRRPAAGRLLRKAFTAWRRPLIFSPPLGQGLADHV